ncbi:MAG: hypothetical protein NVS4B12_04390 [Ktedonobacteraceae bacterium]
MQQTQRREIPEQMSWARAMIFAVGFFFIGALLVGQVPSYIFNEVTSASLLGAEQGSIAFGLTCLASFVVIQVIVLLFDPKPVFPPIIFSALGTILSLGGLAIMLLAVTTGCGPKQTACNQYFPTASTNVLPLLGGKFLWFQPQAFDLVMVGAIVLGVGAAMVFYSILALGEQRNPDRRDIGTTPMIRWMIIIASALLVAFTIFFTYYNDQGIGATLFPGHPFRGEKLVDLILGTVLGVTVFLILGAFALRLHYLMRPVRKRTMSGLYAIGSLGLAQIGAILLLFGLFVYPLIDWIHSWSFIGLGDFLTICGQQTAIPASCAFSPQAGYLIDAIVSTNFFILLAAAIWAWKSHRNLVVIGGVSTVAVLALATLLIHMHPEELLIALLLCGAALVLAAVWTSVARREFAVVGENNLGCVGMWLVVGTCLFIYIGAFAFFSIPGFRETEPNIPFISGLIVPGLPAGPNEPPPIGQGDAVFLLILMGILAGIQFVFLIRNRYRV